MSCKRLYHEYKEYLKDPNPYYSISPDESNFSIWNVLLFGSLGTIYEGYIFKCIFTFPDNYPLKPPEVKFINSIQHPNIYKDGKICISILHEGVDIYQYENINERWSPAQSVNTILISILSLLNEPNFDSAANIDTALMWKNNFTEYKKLIFKEIYNS